MPVRLFRSVRGKLLSVIIVTAFTALAVVSAALMIYDLKTYEQGRVGDLSTLADVLAAAAAPALVFHAPNEAQETLNLLRVRAQIVAGALYDLAGNAVARYSPENLAAADAGALPPPDGYVIRGNRLLLAKPVVEKGERVGTLYLVARYDAGRRLLNSALIFAGAVLVSMVVAVLVSASLGRRLVQPVLDVTRAAHQVREQNDFSVRVRKSTDDEIGYLVDTFNAMLDEVGRRAAALAEADRRKDQFLAVLAHELRNPLSPILNAVFVLQRAREDRAKAGRAVDVLDRQVRLLSRLLDDLLDVARIAQGKIELRLQSVDIRAIVETAVESARPAFAAKRQAFEVNLPEETLHVLADPVRLAQVLGNILNNAAKYTDRGGRIVLTAQRRGADAVFSVKDNGIGIAREDLSRVFEMFTQLSKDRGATGGGLGIGLALARALVQMHGGSVEARSAGLGTGTELIVTLPCVTAGELSRSPQEFSPEEASGPALKVLVADDVTDSAETLRTALQMLGHQVWTASDGAAALELALKIRPDVAILDIGMPELDGYEVAARIRASALGPRPTLIALTGWGQRDDIGKAHAAGFDHHMTKPTDFALMQRLLRTVEPQRASRR